MESYATAQQVFAAGLIFSRLGALVMLIPGVGEQSVPPRIRLSFAFLMTLMLYPVLAARAPGLPPTVGAMALAVIKEVVIGLMIGATLRMFFASMATAGEIVSLQTTLSFSQTAAPGQAQPTASLAAFLILLGLVLVMTTDLHHLFLAAIAQSYSLFPMGHAAPVQDAGALAVQTMGKSFALGLQLAAPVVIFSLIFNIATGLVGRAMPQFQVFFVATPLIVLLGLSLFALSLGTIGMVWVERYRDLVGSFV
jgi:flagellar biosynthetic protein FliR